uniref:Uncharacterized protein n=1 Tax=Steinernema glaseri TaxID=37863 RepID=A0A1I7Z785_9BILA
MRKGSYEAPMTLHLEVIGFPYCMIAVNVTYPSDGLQDLSEGRRTGSVPQHRKLSPHLLKPQPVPMF